MALHNNDGDEYSSTCSSDEEIGYPIAFLDGTFECVICTSTIRELTELPCGHAGCRRCVEKWEKVTISCCKCRKAYKKDLKRPSMYNDRMILHEKQGKCKQKDVGCDWEGTIDEYLNTHRRQCLHKKRRCRRCNNDVHRIDFSNHNLVCSHRTVTCTECSKTYINAFENEHKSKECPKKLCDYQKYGCTVKVSGNGMEKHISSEARSHLKMMEDFYENQLQQKTENISQLQHKFNLAEKQLKSYEDKFSALNTTVPQNQPPIPLPEPNLGGAKPKVPSTPNSLQNTLTVQPSPTNVRQNPKFLKWDGRNYGKISWFGKSFDDVWKMLIDKKLDDVSSIIKEKPNLINSMRGGRGWTFLMKAAFYQRKDIVGYLSNQQHDLSIVNDNGNNVLHYIVGFNDDDVAIEMLKSLDISQLNDDVINKQDNKYKQTPLHYVAWKNKHKSIVWLMDQGADPSLKDVDGDRPDEYRGCSDETKNIIRSFKKLCDLR